MDMFSRQERAQQVLRQHLIAVEMSMEELNEESLVYTLEGVPAEVFYKVNVTLLRMLLMSPPTLLFVNLVKNKSLVYIVFLKDTIILSLMCNFMSLS